MYVFFLHSDVARFRSPLFVDTEIYVCFFCSLRLSVVVLNADTYRARMDVYTRCIIKMGLKEALFNNHIVG